MKTKSIFFSIVLFFLFKFSYSQSCPPNLDFEKGDFYNWQCFTGTASTFDGKNVMTLNPSAPTINRHEIITASSFPKKDPYGNFPVLCPYGGNYSVKLGNNVSGGEAEGLSYTFTVPTTVDTFTFTYFYAVVFEDPSHAIDEQPRFFVTAYDVASGDIINCASYDYVSNGGIPGFEKAESNPGVLYKSWTPTSLQFAGLGGRSVRLEFKTADCTLSGHFGYAYVDVGSGCSNILATAPYCIETNSLLLNAPYGFQTYTWYNSDFSAVIGNKQSITLTPPPVTSGVFHVDAVPYPGYGCRDTFHAVVTPLPVPDIPLATDYTFCQFSIASPLQATPTPGNELVWYIGDTTTPGVEKAPVPSTAIAGEYVYYVAQKVLFGCEGFRKKITVKIVPTPVTSFTANNLRQCENGNNFVFTSTTTNQSNSVYTWDFGNGKTISSESDVVVTHKYTTGGQFNVKLKVENHGTCSSERNVVVAVIPKPIAQFQYPQVICEKQTPLSVVDQSFVSGGVAVVNKWWWNIDGIIWQTRTPGSFVPDKPGPLSIKLVATTSEGCYSDTALVTVPVHYRPSAAFKFNNPLCNNEIIRFTDHSNLPLATRSESVVKWQWQLSNTGSNMQHPSLHLNPGVYHAKLVAETNYGCKSIEADSVFTVHAKPAIQLGINDSCVFRSIVYNALDLQNTVHQWYWNLGNNLHKGKETVIKSYTTEGYRPVTLIGQTIQGCKDTIFRPFTIYDNKAFAGRDTITAIDEPVQLNARGGSTVTYAWSPATGLNDATLENPVATLDKDQLYRLDAISREGCDSHSDILIKRFKGPELYIPTGFTPNSDSKNDVLKVFPVGVKKFHYMAVYNRYGEVIFRTTDPAIGWDGTYKGQQLTTNTFVVIAEAIDYKGRPLLKKVTVTLIR